MKLSNGKQIFVETTGDGPAVVFVHGLGGTTNFYEPQVAALAENHKVVRFDLPGEAFFVRTKRLSPRRGSALVRWVCVIGGVRRGTPR